MKINVILDTLYCHRASFDIILALRQKGLFLHCKPLDLNGEMLPSQDNTNDLLRTILFSSYLCSQGTSLHSQTCSNLEKKVTVFLGTLNVAFPNTGHAHIFSQFICILFLILCIPNSYCPQEIHNKPLSNKNVHSVKNV